MFRAAKPELRQIEIETPARLAFDSSMEQFNLLEGSTQAKNGGKQIGNEEKKAAVHEEIKKVNQLPAHSTYATHRMRVLNKILQLLSVQRTISQDEELQLLFAGLSI
ncbi:hypothetical protein L1987_07395 [Smallanthus sonchifolius]|uniref:Uncharacterized protein n=1 Tax=Smallanthus sonchifolius TaxID=185202 RepID=A0ACB9K0L7_9ASTR|nr:hypothetical protein L1987_07395 [Smallanthus sonchifolius]